MTDVFKNCLACGDIIRVRLADHKRGWGNFCGKDCSAAYKCGQRPKDVNAGHTQSAWAMERLSYFQATYGGAPPKAISIQEQTGLNIRVKKPPTRRQALPRQFYDEDLSWDAHKMEIGDGKL